MSSRAAHNWPSMRRHQPSAHVRGGDYVRRLIGLLAVPILLVALATPAAAISYGQVDSKNQFSNVGAVIGEDDGALYAWCSGTLISPTVFLTAAHCVEDGATMWVSFDLTIPEDPETGEVLTRKLKTFYEGTAYAHPDAWSGGMNDAYDIAVIVFNKPVRGITPATLPTLDYLEGFTAQQLQSSTFYAAGYGTVRDTKQGAGQALYWDPTRRFATQSFNSLTDAWLTLSMNQATGDGGTCYGDSGGPHFVNGVLVSITVTGDIFCKASDKTYRIDTQVARDFLDDFVTLP
jgi:secreted trypsin-like serine protease